VIDGISDLLAGAAQRREWQSQTSRKTKHPFRNLRWVRIDPEPSGFVFPINKGLIYRAELAVPFEIMDTLLTEFQYVRCTGGRPPDRSRAISEPKTTWRLGNQTIELHADYPVEVPSYKQQIIRPLLDRLNARGDGYHYALPSLIEWLYVATLRGERFFEGQFWGSRPGHEIGWFKGGRPHAVAGKAPLFWGDQQQPIWDLFGNTWQAVWALSGLARDPRQAIWRQTRMPSALLSKQANLSIAGCSYRNDGSDAQQLSLWTDGRIVANGFRLVRYLLADHARLPLSPTVKEVR
jgi:hypothetical protein